MTQIAIDEEERLRRWRLAIGEEASQLSDKDQRLSAALGALYESSSQRKGKGGLGASAPRVSRWLRCSPGGSSASRRSMFRRWWAPSLR